MSKPQISRLCFLSMLLTIVVSGCALLPVAKCELHDGTLSVQAWPGNPEGVNFTEPSGIVYHEQRGTLFVVGDEGHMAEFGLDGQLVKRAHVRFADFEGITYNPETNLLYVAVEGEELILEFDPHDFELLRQFSIDRYYQGELLLPSGGQGVEAITFVPNPDHPQGGTFYLTNQSQGSEGDEPSLLIEVEVPLTSQATESLTAQVSMAIPMATLDLSGLHYDSVCGHLILISDRGNTLQVIGLDGEIAATYALPGQDQEGITLDAQDNIYIAQDSGAILRATWDQ
ncbi:MAG: SdiA-regulated domain-containing protein [Anaerolineales bacterium]|nr:SdiA-regulated domain-containing protein [Chloroflexota bacterium]MBL6980891.1 SdiA-regulated domain-containing protein [Anaerolineales bacterium]